MNINYKMYIRTSAARILLEKNDKQKRDLDSVDKKTRGPKDLKDKVEDENDEWPRVESKPSSPTVKAGMKDSDMQPRSLPLHASVAVHEST